MISPIMAPPPPPRQLCHLRISLLLVSAVAAFLCTTTTVPAVAAQPQEGYCRDSLAGLKQCDGFMYGGAGAPSAACCAAYEAAFDADPFCLCYVADGTYARATGYDDIDVAHALQIPATCGQGQPPIELCNMEGLVLPPYAPQDTLPAQPPSAAAGAPNALPPSASASGSSSSSPVPPPPTFTTSPPPPSTSGAPDLLPRLVMLIVGALIFLVLI